MLRLALLISGSGTTMEQILLACYNGLLKGLVEPVLVIASKYGIGGIDRARRVGFPEKDIMICDPKMFRSREEWGETLEAMLRNSRVDIVGQYGWKSLTPAIVIATYKGRIINQHPGPLDFGHLGFGGEGMYGRRVHCARLFFARMTANPRDQYSEATTHIVTEKYDDGPVIGRTVVPILPSDDVTTLQERILPEEHKLQIAILKMIAEAGGEITHGMVDQREERLILPGQEPLLAMSKMVAWMLFPKG